MEDEVRTLIYHKDEFQPEDLLFFVEMSTFTRSWASCGLSDDDDLSALQMMIMSDPKAAPVVRGTGGLRKLRFARQGEGKRAGFRVGYVYLEKYGLVLLILVFRKGDLDNITNKERNDIKRLIDSFEPYLKERYGF